MSKIGYSTEHGNKTLMTSTSRPTLTDLIRNPYILSEILEHLPNSTLVALTVTSKHLFTAASMKLYRTLRLTRRQFITLVEAGQVPFKRLFKWRTFSPFLEEALGRVTTLHLSDDYKLGWVLPKLPQGVFRSLTRVVLGRHPDLYGGQLLTLPVELLDALSDTIRSVTILVHSAWEVRCSPAKPAVWSNYLQRGKSVTVVLLPTGTDSEQWRAMSKPWMEWNLGECVENPVRLVGAEYAGLASAKGDHITTDAETGLISCDSVVCLPFVKWIEESLPRMIFSAEEEEQYRASDRKLRDLV